MKVHIDAEEQYPVYSVEVVGASWMKGIFPEIEIKNETWERYIAAYEEWSEVQHLLDELYEKPNLRREKS